MENLKARMAKSITGQEQVFERFLLTLLCNGNVLVEVLPGLAETRASRVPHACRSRFDDLGSFLLPLSAMLYGRERQQPAAGHWDQANEALNDARRARRTGSKETMRSRSLP